MSVATIGLVIDGGSGLLSAQGPPNLDHPGHRRVGSEEPSVSCKAKVPRRRTSYPSGSGASGRSSTCVAPPRRLPAGRESQSAASAIGCAPSHSAAKRVQERRGPSRSGHLLSRNASVGRPARAPLSARSSLRGEKTCLSAKRRPRLVGDELALRQAELGQPIRRACSVGERKRREKATISSPRRKIGVPRSRHATIPRDLRAVGFSTTGPGGDPLKTSSVSQSDTVVSGLSAPPTKLRLRTALHRRVPARSRSAPLASMRSTSWW
jgi:hypothetical protein